MRRRAAVPRAAAGTEPTQRDQHILVIQEQGRLGWQKAVGYGSRSLGVVAMLRYQVAVGQGLRARTLRAQKVAATVGCRVINMMTNFGMPASCMVG